MSLRSTDEFLGIKRDPSVYTAEGNLKGGPLDPPKNLAQPLSALNDAHEKIREQNHAHQVATEATQPGSPFVQFGPNGEDLGCGTSSCITPKSDQATLTTRASRASESLKSTLSELSDLQGWIGFGEDPPNARFLVRKIADELHHRISDHISAELALAESRNPWKKMFELNYENKVNELNYKLPAPSLAGEVSSLQGQVDSLVDDFASTANDLDKRVTDSEEMIKALTHDSQNWEQQLHQLHLRTLAHDQRLFVLDKAAVKVQQSKTDYVLFLRNITELATRLTKLEQAEARRKRRRKQTA